MPCDMKAECARKLRHRKGNITRDRLIFSRKQSTVALFMTLIILLKHVSVSEREGGGREGERGGGRESERKRGGGGGARPRKREREINRQTDRQTDMDIDRE